MASRYYYFCERRDETRRQVGSGRAPNKYSDSDFFYFPFFFAHASTRACGVSL